MKIAFLTPEYPHPNTGSSGGIGTSIKNLAEALTQLGHQVHILVYAQNQDKVFKDKGITFHQIQNRKLKGLSWWLTRKKIEQYINDLYAKKQIDILEAPDWTGITAYMKLKLPLVIRLHGTDSYFCKLENRPQKWFNKWLEKQALKKAAGYISPTVYAGEVTKNIFKLEQAKIKNIPNGIKLNNFKNKTPETYQSNTLLYVGTIIRKKGILELAEIFNKLIIQKLECKLILIGNDTPDIITKSDSTYKLFKSKLSERAKLQVQYMGKIPYEEVQKHIINAHVCVFPSLAETQGMVTIESMALQKPVISSSLGWAQEIINDSFDGYLVHPNDKDEYVEKILKLFNDNDLCLKISKNAHRKVSSKFDTMKIAVKNINYFESLLKK